MAVTTDSAIIANNLSIMTERGKEILKNVSFRVNAKDKIAVIGAEGSGKSALVEFLVGLERPGFKYSGDLYLSGLGGYLPQELSSLWNSTQVIEFLFKSKPDEKIDTGYWNDFNRCINAFSQVNLSEELLYQEVGVLSGGEKVRVQLVKLILKNPSYLLMDEPTNNLDIETVRWLENFIKNSKIPILFVSHDEALIRKCATGILYLAYRAYDNRSFSYFSSEDYDSFRKRLERQVEKAEQERQGLKDDIKEMKKKYSEQQSIASGKNSFSSAEDVSTKSAMTSAAAKGASLAGRLGKKLQVMQEELEEFEVPHIDQFVKIDFPRNCEIPNGKVVLRLKNFVLEINGKILSPSIDLEIVGSEKVGIIGRNGTGKSTLLQSIRYNKQKLGIRLGYMPQNFNEILVDPNKSALEHLMKLGGSEQSIRTLMSRMGFIRDEMINSVSDLSGGQRGKLILIQMILEEANFLILDEPTRNLSPLTAPVLKEQIQSFPGAILIVSHDRQFLYDVCDRVLELSTIGLKIVPKEEII